MTCAPARRAARHALALGDRRQTHRLMLRRCDSFASFLDDGRACLSNNTAERALRGFALGRKSLAVCGLQPRRRACRRHGDADPDLLMPRAA
ncbi:IS66 family transposase [Bradyrhizobium sp. Arg314]